MGNRERQDGREAAWKHPPMPREQRAKQFMPFKAVTGLEEALQAKEIAWAEAQADVFARPEEEVPPEPEEP